MFRRSRGKRTNVSIPKRRWKGSCPVQKEWDSTLSDLTVHKASDEEIQRRRLIHRSKNAGAARRALGERAKKLFMDPASPGQVALEMKKLAILKEVLYDHDDLNEVLKRADHTMSSVKTMFHGVPFRTSGNPNCTPAPGSKSSANYNGPVSIREEPTTQMSLLSDSVMDKRALNEEISSSEEEEDEKFESKVDYERFLNVLRESLNKSMIPSQNEPSDDVSVTPANNGKPEFQRPALNCTEEVERTMARFAPTSENKHDKNKPLSPKKIDDTIAKFTTSKGINSKKKNQSVSFSVADDSSTLPPPRANLTATNMTYENLQEAMESVANNLSAMENRRGKSLAADTTIKSDGLAGFTATLIDAVTRLTVYVNEAESKLVATESHVEDLKNRNDHQRALLDALTAELMSTQEQIANLKERSEEEKKKIARQHEDYKNSVEIKMKDLSDRIDEIGKKHKGVKNGAGDGKFMSSETHGKELTDGLQIIEGSTANDKEKREEALKSDMLSLLGALKSQKLEMPTQVDPHPSAQIHPMNNVMTMGAAQTVASVESQLKHLQLQHAEAQNRLQELTQVAGVLAGKVKSESQSSTSGGSGPATPATSTSSATPSIVSGPLTPHEGSNEFQPMIPSHADETDDSVSGITITSSMFANVDTSRPSVQSNGFHHAATSPSTERRIVVEDSISMKSSERINISEDSFHELECRNLPVLLQSNIYGASVHTNAAKEFNYFRPRDANKEQSTLPPFKPTTVSANPQSVTTSIQQTQFNLEDRIAELNRQHAEAQARLQNLIRKRTDGRSPSPLSTFSTGSGSVKVIQVALPSDDMLKTPQVRRPPEPFKPMTLSEDDSFV